MCKISVNISGYDGDPVLFLQALVVNQRDSFTKEKIIQLAQKGGLDDPDKLLDLVLKSLCEKGLYYQSFDTYYPERQFAIAF